jgi:hypothetical protein
MLSFKKIISAFNKNSQQFFKTIWSESKVKLSFRYLILQIFVFLADFPGGLSSPGGMITPGPGLYWPTPPGPGSLFNIMKNFASAPSDGL